MRQTINKIKMLAILFSRGLYAYSREWYKYHHFFTCPYHELMMNLYSSFSLYSQQQDSTNRVRGSLAYNVLVAVILQFMRGRKCNSRFPEVDEDVAYKRRCLETTSLWHQNIGFTLDLITKCVKNLLDCRVCFIFIESTLRTNPLSFAVSIHRRWGRRSDSEERFWVRRSHERDGSLDRPSREQPGVRAIMTIVIFPISHTSLCVSMIQNAWKYPLV